MRTSAWLLVLAFRAAHADDDDATAVDGTTEISLRAPPRLELPDGPLLPLGGAPRWRAAAAAPDHAAQVLDLGSGVRLSAEGEWWTTALLSPLSALDGIQHGWRAAYRMSYDLGPFRVGAHVGVGQVEGRLERAVVRFAGLSATRTLRLSPWMLAWISLSAGVEQWSGVPPLGERTGAEVKITVGTTFR